MNYITSLETSHISIAAAGVAIAILIVNMGLFGKNQLPVEGKVRHSFSYLLALHTADKGARLSSSQEALKAWG